jgi:hypothetical protein
VLHGHKRISYGFAIATFATNLSYYAMHGVDLTSIAGAPAWLMAGLLPAAIVGYSHTIADAPPVATPAEAQTKPGRDWWRFWREPLEADATSNLTASTIPTPVARPVGTLAHPGAMGAASQPAAQSTNTPDSDASPKLTPEQRREQIASAGLQSTAEVMQTFAIGKRTADADLAWVRKNIMHTNGVAK